MLFVVCEINSIELALKKIYDEWDLGNELDKNPKYSAMFRMGFPDEFIDDNKPVLMYVGQECLRCNNEKTQEWVRKYQSLQMKKEYIDGFCEEINSSPFWSFYRKIADKGYNVLWNNLDKFHPYDSARVTGEDAERFNAQYGEDNKSVFQREIELIKPKVILLTVGPKRKYIQSLCSALGISNISMMQKFKPTKSKPVSDLTEVIAIPDTKVLWTYHPAYLNRIKKYSDILDEL